MSILFIILYFFIVGGVFYKLFISPPAEQKLVKKPVIEPVQELAKEFMQEPKTSNFTSNEAADINVG